MKALLQNSIFRTLLPIGLLGLLVVGVVFMSGHKAQLVSSPGTLGGSVGNQAPELTGIASWINSNGESIHKLKGKVVLIDFWTYSCINCLRTLPHTTSWYEKYKDKGFVVLGLSAPEFAFEHNRDNVARAVIDNHITYPVGLDNDLATWNAYKNQYWPAEYLIDKDGVVRYTHFGEGNYSKTEATIQKLLAEKGSSVTASIDKTADTAPVGAEQTPETYLNYGRGGNFANVDQFKADQTVDYTVKTTAANQWSLGNRWVIGSNQSTADVDKAQLRITFSSKEVYLVMDGPAGEVATIALNGRPLTEVNAGSDANTNSQIRFDGARLYKLVKSPVLLKNATLDIVVPKGTTINAFTFGS